MTPPPDADKGGGLGKTRVEAFSDGVFSIAITLLVLDIRLPSGLAESALTQALRALAPRLLSYGLSFAIIGVYWVAHQGMLRAARRTDRTFLWLNNLCLLFIAFIPASAAMLGAYHDAPHILQWYGVNLMLATGTLELLWAYITRRLADSVLSSALVRQGHRRNLSSLLIYAVAVCLAPISVKASLAVYWLGPIVYIFRQTLRDDARV